jgi:hypothetical protein
LGEEGGGWGEEEAGFCVTVGVYCSIWPRRYRVYIRETRQLYLDCVGQINTLGAYVPVACSSPTYSYLSLTWNIKNRFIECEESSHRANSFIR